MATISQVRGMLLEEAVMQLLRTAGYGVVEKAGSDPTLCDGHSGLEVLGRGGRHQIDSVADFRVCAPFSHPQRLFVEAKCYSPQYPVGLPIIRNAVGVLKDVSEWWNPPAGLGATSGTGRYHYQYAVFSASGYTLDAERYAFAQDIYLIPYERSRYIAPVIQAIRQVTHQDLGARAWNAIDIDLTSLRHAVRGLLQGRVNNLTPFTIAVAPAVRSFVEAVSAIKGTLFAVMGRQFPVHLIPAPPLDVRELRDHYEVRIWWDDRSWYLEDTRDQRPLFSFDLPPELFNLYAEDGRLTESRALDLKSEMLNSFQAVVNVEDTMRLITFDLDRNWIAGVRQQIAGLPRRRDAQFQDEADRP
jgi:hypothetical protein